MSNDQTVKWIHLSDLHFRKGDEYDRNIVLNSLLEDITVIQERENFAPDFIFITGGRPLGSDLNIDI